MSIELTRRGLVLGSAAMLAAARFGPAGAAALAPLRFGTSAGINTAIQPCLYAKTSGLYEKYGLNVSFVDMQDDTTAMQALIADACDMLYAGAGTGMIAVTRGAKIKLVSSFTPWTDFVMLAQKDVTERQAASGQGRWHLETWGAELPGDCLCLEAGGCRSEFGAVPRNRDGRPTCAGLGRWQDRGGDRERCCGGRGAGREARPPHAV